MTREEQEAAQARCDLASPPPWQYDSYGTVFSVSLVQNEKRSRYPDGPRPGPPFLIGDDAEWMQRLQKAYDDDPIVLHVPAISGDTATGRHSEDAVFCAHARTDLPAALAEIRRLEVRVQHLESVLASVEFGCEPGNCPECGGNRQHIEPCLVGVALRGVKP